MNEDAPHPPKAVISNVFLLVLLSVLVFLGFIPSLKNGFVSWDDPAYVLTNPFIRNLKLGNIVEVFSSFNVGSYHPLTTLSFAFDYFSAGFNPAMYHAHSLLLHVINVWLVFFFTRRLTGNMMTAFLVSFMFGLHPTRVESVAWVTERKDVLFGLFYLLGLNSYLAYIHEKLLKKKFILLTFFFFILSLLSKPAAVSFPLVLLLIDYYKKDRMPVKDILPKLPFFALSAVFGYVTLLGGYSSSGNTYPPPLFNFVDRLILCFYAVGMYINKWLVPVNLSCFYPYPVKDGMFFSQSVYFISLFAAFFLYGLLYFSKFHKLVVFGVGFFLSSIFFNLPLFGIGYTVTADRFTYLPYIGIFLIFSSAIVFFYSKISGLMQFGVKAAVTCFFIVYFILTMNQCRIWQDDLSLWGRVINKQPAHALVYYNFANALFDEMNAPDLAYMSYSKAIELYPSYFAAYNNRGNMSFMMGSKDAALKDYNRAIEINSSYIPSYLNRAEYYAAIGQIDMAVRDYEKVLTINPLHATAKEKLSRFLAK